MNGQPPPPPAPVVPPAAAGAPPAVAPAVVAPQPQQPAQPPAQPQPQQPMQPAVVAGGPTTYRQFYSDVANDPYGGRYTDAMQTYAVPVNNHDTTPFRLCDIKLSIGPQRLDLATSTDNQLDIATFATYEFTTQKNGVRGEVIGLGRSGNLLLCPVIATTRRAKHLRHFNAPPTQALSTYYKNNAWHAVTPADITSTLRTAVLLLGPANLGFMPSDISARSLRATGAMALLCAHVDTDIIRLLGRWRSDEMLRYLHLQAEPIMRDYASRMLNHGNFVLHPNNDVPIL